MHKKIAFIWAIAAVAIPFSPVFGQTTDLAIQQNADQRTQMRQGIEAQKQKMQAGRQELAKRRLEFQDKKEKMVEEKCKNIEGKIATRIGRYENNQTMTQKVYSNMQDRLIRLVARLDAAGADTAKLKNDIATLNTMIEKMKADQTTFMTTLKESQAFVCGNSEGAFKGKIEQARKLPGLFKQDRADIKKFFQTTIKADLQAIRKTLAEQKETTETTEATETPKAPEVAPTPAQ